VGWEEVFRGGNEAELLHIILDDGKQHGRTIMCFADAFLVHLFGRRIVLKRGQVSHLPLPCRWTTSLYSAQASKWD
jgi:hypothetical protein